MSGWIDLLSWILHWPGMDPDAQRLLVGANEDPYELEGTLALAYSLAGADGNPYPLKGATTTAYRLVGPEQDTYETS